MRAYDDAAELAEALKGKRAAVLFQANWCPFCRAFKPVFEKIVGGEEQLTPIEATLDDEENPLWALYRVDVVPTVVLFLDGKPVRRADGRLGLGLQERDLRQLLDG